MDATPLVLTRLTVAADWTDANGHMNVAYYVLAFDRATDALYDALGIGWDYVRRDGKSLFTLAMNVDYVRETKAGDGLAIATRVLDHDEKRIHYFHEMSHAGQGFLAATNELLAMHVDMATRRSAPFDAPVLARLAAMQAAHARLPRPERQGRNLGIRRAAAPPASGPTGTPAAGNR